MINNSVAVQKERWSIWLYVFSEKSVLAVMYLRRVEINGRSYAAALMQVSSAVTPPVHAAQNNKKRLHTRAGSE
jgi:hypothetical protein